MNTLLYFIIAHFVGTDTLSNIQANTTRRNIRLGYFAFKLSLGDLQSKLLGVCVTGVKVRRGEG